MPKTQPFVRHLRCKPVWSVAEAWVGSLAGWRFGTSRFEACGWAVGEHGHGQRPPACGAPPLLRSGTWC